MTRLNDPRCRLPLTPSLKLSREELHIDPAMGTNGPTSPPESPSMSSQMAGKSSQAGAFYRFTQPLAQDPNIKPVGNGHQFSYRRTVLDLEQLSPRSSSSSSDAKQDSDGESSAAEVVPTRSVADSSMANSSDDEIDADEEGGGDENVDEDGDNGGNPAAHRKARAGPSRRLASSSPSVSVAASGVDGATCQSRSRSRLHAATLSGSGLVGDFVIEEIDLMDSEYEGLEILHPTEIESNHSRSRSRHKGVDRGMVRDFQNLNCSNETSDEEAGDLQLPGMDAEVFFRQRQRELRRIRRVSMSSSFGKRTHSELGSESGDSDTGAMDVNDVGSSARRLRKRLHRGSLLFHDTPAPRIDELEEPDSSTEEYDAADPFARELPYFTMEIMEMDSA
ncbi:hypothetical protein E4U43_007881 [Claviceps pusilla]|uniref:Uncharacterized protein n=1 Tax=Claviceps pusilla TaxID=123648 RepID=A0A9P7NC26_9HYPO|nr:hypothetical protein E4U43_007881 [Claviceps pusilla]